jgi:hypothetical protein
MGDTLIGHGAVFDVGPDGSTWKTVDNIKNVSVNGDIALADATTLDSNGDTQKKYGNRTMTADVTAIYDSAEHATTNGQGFLFDEFFTSQAGIYVRLRPSIDTSTADKLISFPALVSSLNIDVSDSGEVIEFSCSMESNGAPTYTDQTP